jgi:undecaprenyl pyrophosphate synthase
MVKSYRNSRSLNNRRKRNTRRTKGGLKDDINIEVTNLMNDISKFFNEPTLNQKNSIKIRLPGVISRLQSAIQLTTNELEKNILKNKLTTINVASDMVDDTTTIPSPQRSRSRSTSRNR